MLVVAVGDVLVLDFRVKHVRAHRKLPLSSADILVQPVDGPVVVVLPRVDSRRADPLQGPRQVHGLVLVLDERGNEGLEIRPPRPLVVRSTSGRKVPLGAQKAQRAHVAVEDVDGLQPALETVQLQRCDVAVLLLVQARPVPEDEHLPVTDFHGLPCRTSRKVPRYVEIRQELADVGKELAFGVGVLRAGPAVGEHDDERAVLRDAPRVHGLAWESVARGQHEGSSDAYLLALPLQPRARQQTHGRIVPALHAQPGELTKIGERFLALLLVKHLAGKRH